MAYMGQDLSNYDHQDQNFEPVPPGEYLLRVVDSKISQSKAGNMMAEFELEIEGPSFAGRKVWERFVLNNEIALKRMKAFAVACGHPNPNYIGDTEELHGRSCLAKLGIQEDKTGQYEPRNNIKWFKPPTAAASASPGASGPMARPAAYPPAGGPAGRPAVPSSAPGPRPAPNTAPPTAAPAAPASQPAAPPAGQVAAPAPASGGPPWGGAVPAGAPAAQAPAPASAAIPPSSAPQAAAPWTR